MWGPDAKSLSEPVVNLACNRNHHFSYSSLLQRSSKQQDDDENTHLLPCWVSLSACCGVHLLDQRWGQKPRQTEILILFEPHRLESMKGRNCTTLHLCCKYQERWVEWKKTGGGSRRILQRSSPARWDVGRDSLWLSKQNHRKEIGPEQRILVHHVCLHLHLNHAQSTYCLLNHWRKLNKPKFLCFLLYPGLGKKNCMTYKISNGAYVSYQYQKRSSSLKNKKRKKNHQTWQDLPYSK